MTRITCIWEDAVERVYKYFMYKLNKLDVKQSLKGYLQRIYFDQVTLRLVVGQRKSLYRSYFLSIEGCKVEVPKNVQS